MDYPAYPVPDLSDSGELMVAQSVQQSVEQGFRGDLRSLVYSLKSEAARKELEHAQDIADNMMKLITDQCAEGGGTGPCSASSTISACTPMLYWLVLYRPAVSVCSGRARP